MNFSFVSTTSLCMNTIREADKVLVSIAINKAMDCLDDSATFLTKRQQVADILLSYIQTENYWAAASALGDLIGTIKPLEFIQSILSLPSTPIPYSSSNPIFQSCQRSQLRRPWSEYEDMRLIAGIHKYGMMDFHLVAKFVGNGRTQWQCRQRWTRGIDPSISKEKWTEAEDNELMNAVKIFGSKQWKKVATKVPNRSDVQCRYRYLLLTRRNTFEAEAETPAETETTEKRERIILPSIQTLDPLLSASPFLTAILCGN